MERFLVMDVVFYGSSLNYDQGNGNYQELKKITRWDGRQYTLVSRYALRYSMLNDSGIFGGNNLPLAPGTVFEKEKDNNKKGVFNPKPDVLFNGEILKYPEFDLFGYLVTKSEPTQSRTAPVRISHAVSMTPFYYDAHFSGNHWIAQRALKAGLTTKLEPNLFTAEEHHTYYIYTVVVDVNNVGRFSIFTTKIDDVKTVLKNLNAGGDNAEKIRDYKDSFESASEGKKSKGKKKGQVPTESLTLSSKNGKLEIAGIRLEELRITPIVDPTGNSREVKLYEIQFELGEKARKERIIKLVEAILNLKRKIKGRVEFLTPKLLILGIYKNKPYDSFKDRIQLLGEFEEEEYVEIEEKDGKIIKKIKRTLSGENGTEEYVEEVVESKPKNSSEKTVRVRKRRSVSRKRTAVFEINGINGNIKEVRFKEVLICYIEKLLFNESKNCEEEDKGGTIPEILIFRDPSIEVRLK